MSGKYWLKRWVFAAECNGHLVFLDVKKDVYYFLEREEARLIKPLLYSAAEPIAGPSSQNIPLDVDPDIIREMICNKLIESNQKHGKIYECCKAIPPINRFEHTEFDHEPPLLWHHVANGIILGLLVHVALKVLPLRLLVWIISKRNLQLTSSDGESHAIALASIYRRVRPYLYRSRLCLYDTFVFYFFSSIYGISPSLVFGVTVEPFEAHCWAQYGSLILNDVPQRTGKYTPIMIL